MRHRDVERGAPGAVGAVASVFRTVRAVDDGSAVRSGGGAELDTASATVRELAERAVTPADFGAFMKRNG